MPGIFARIRAFFASAFTGKGKKTGASGVNASQSVALKRPFSLSKDCDLNDPLMREILERDCQGVDSPLALMKKYCDQLNVASSRGTIDDKLDKLFLAGKTPANLDGFFHGITISIKTGVASNEMLGKLKSVLGADAEIDPLQIIYGRILSKQSPWAGKNFKKLNGKKLSELTSGAETGEREAFLGINSFRRANKDVVNNLAGEVLSTIIDMEGVPGPEGKQHSWIYAKGGMFIAQKRMSIDPANPKREVLSLNYRWKNLGNRLPNRLLIDEIVEIAQGLFLGKLYYATSLTHMLQPFDPGVPAEEYKYGGFGYFLLMDNSWLHEKNMLFPDLTYTMADNLPKKFTTLHLVDNSPHSEMLKKQAKEKKTVLHYLQAFSKGVEEGAESEARYFESMQHLFACGQRPDGIVGFLHGSVVAFKSSGFLKKFGQNILNDLWPKVRPFSPWSGKAFTPTTVEKIKKYIGDGAAYYANAPLILLGSNTYRKELGLSLAATAFVQHLNAIGMAVQYPDTTEAESDIYVKSFFFIAQNAVSVSPANKGRQVLQLNYRWPKLHTMPPDHLCVDELVRIADGLYLGEMQYATRAEIPFNPGTDPAAYHYENFGYFMLMDDEWWAIKEFIRFDTEK